MQSLFSGHRYLVPIYGNLKLYQYICVMGWRRGQSLFRWGMLSSHSCTSFLPIPALFSVYQCYNVILFCLCHASNETTLEKLTSECCSLICSVFVDVIKVEYTSGIYLTFSFLLRLSYPLVTTSFQQWASISFRAKSRWGLGIPLEPGRKELLHCPSSSNRYVAGSKCEVLVSLRSDAGILLMSGGNDLIFGQNSMVRNWLVLP